VQRAEQSGRGVIHSHGTREPPRHRPAEAFLGKGQSSQPQANPKRWRCPGQTRIASLNLSCGGAFVIIWVDVCGVRIPFPAIVSQAQGIYQFIPATKKLGLRCLVLLPSCLTSYLALFSLCKVFGSVLDMCPVSSLMKVLLGRGRFV
jgi:hypothetical protein